MNSWLMTQLTSLLLQFCIILCITLSLKNYQSEKHHKYKKFCSGREDDIVPVQTKLSVCIDLSQSRPTSRKINRKKKWWPGGWGQLHVTHRISGAFEHAGESSLWCDGDKDGKVSLVVFSENTYLVIKKARWAPIPLRIWTSRSW